MSDVPARFRPPWWATAGTLVLGALFVTAGVWQLDRAAEKRALLAAFAAGPATPPLPAPAPGADVGALRYRVIEAGGSYDARHQVLLDQRTRDGHVGYEVLTPLRADGFAVLVNRGWVPAPADRNELPDISVAAGARGVRGLLDRLPRAALGRGGSEGDGWPRRMLYPTAAQIGAALGYPVADYQLLLPADAPDGYRRDWRPTDMPPERHVGYAVQWFALAAALVVIYAALNLRRSRRAGKT